MQASFSVFDPCDSATIEAYQEVIHIDGNQDSERHVTG